jgi:hypothetical protein
MAPVRTAPAAIFSELIAAFVSVSSITEHPLVWASSLAPETRDLRVLFASAIAFECCHETAKHRELGKFVRRLFGMKDATATLLPDLKSHAYYRARGEEVRERAASIKSAAAKSKFLQIADTYDRLAIAEEMSSKPHNRALG